jgi:hypothetical protein
MRIRMLVMLTIATVGTAMPAVAQTYNPANPFCMRLYTIDGEDVECEYSSLQQCKQSASGRPATCIPNPYAKAAAPAPVEQQAPGPAPAPAPAAKKKSKSARPAN